MNYLEGRRSNFPQSGKVDKILELFNLPASQRENALEFKQLKAKRDLTEENENRLRVLAEELQSYIIDVEKWNFFGDVIVNMQDHYLNETVGFINDLQDKGRVFLERTEVHMTELKHQADVHLGETEDFMNVLKADTEQHVLNKREEFQGEVDKVTYRGEWLPEADYYEKNIVTSGGNGYIAQKDSRGVAPTNTLYWGKITSKGDKGDPSLNINYQGNYQAGKTYMEGDAITFGSLWYYAKGETLGNPPTNEDFWELQTNQTHIGTTEPSDKRLNLWIDTNAEMLRYYSDVTGTRVPIKAGGLVTPDGTQLTADMVKAMKAVFDNIPSNPLYTDTIYKHPDTHSADMIDENVKRRFVSDAEKAGWNSKLDKSGGTMTGIAKAYSNNSHTTAQMRNVILSTGNAVASQMGEGDIWIKYE